MIEIKGNMLLLAGGTNAAPPKIAELWSASLPIS